MVVVVGGGGGGGETDVPFTNHPVVPTQHSNHRFATQMPESEAWGVALNVYYSLPAE